MTPRELEQLEKKSIYTLRMNDDLKDQVINGHLNNLVKFIKKELKQSRIHVMVFVKDH